MQLTAHGVGRHVKTHDLMNGRVDELYAPPNPWSKSGIDRSWIKADLRLEGSFWFDFHLDVVDTLDLLALAHQRNDRAELIRRLATMLSDDDVVSLLTSKYRNTRVSTLILKLRRPPQSS